MFKTVLFEILGALEFAAFMALLLFGCHWLSKLLGLGGDGK